MPKPDDDDQQQGQDHDDDDERSSVDDRLDKVEETQTTILSRIDALFDAIKPKSDPKPAPKVDDDDDETPPKIITQVTTRQEIEEKAPRPAHFLFRRLGGR